jgi:hypothetical protein
MNIRISSCRVVILVNTALGLLSSRALYELYTNYMELSPS